MKKRVTLVIPGAGEEAEARDGEIEAGDTVADVLRAADKDPSTWRAYLQRSNGDVSLNAQDDLFAAIVDGEKVFVEPASMVVG